MAGQIGRDIVNVLRGGGMRAKGDARPSISAFDHVVLICGDWKRVGWDLGTRVWRRGVIFYTAVHIY